MRLDLIVGLNLFLAAVQCSFSKNKVNNKSLRLNSNTSDDFDLVQKRFKRFDDNLIEEIRDAIHHDEYDLFMEYVIKHGSLILRISEPFLLKYIVENDKIGLLEYFFENSNSQGLGDTFDVLLEIISLAAPERQDIIKALAVPKHIKLYEHEVAILHYFMGMKDEISFKTVLKICLTWLYRTTGLL